MDWRRTVGLGAVACSVGLCTPSAGAEPDHIPSVGVAMLETGNTGVHGRYIGLAGGERLIAYQPNPWVVVFQDHGGGAIAGAAGCLNTHVFRVVCTSDSPLEPTVIHLGPGNDFVDTTGGVAPFEGGMYIDCGRGIDQSVHLPGDHLANCEIT